MNTENPTQSVRIASATGALSGSMEKKMPDFPDGQTLPPFRGELDSVFPPGDVARQERYIAAFRGLTQLIAVSRDEWPWAGEKWTEMFETLAGPASQTPLEVDSPAESEESDGK